MRKEIDTDAVVSQLEQENDIPAQEPDRQLYFIERCREHVEKESERLGRPLTASVQTFGCQMNARDSEKLCGILEQAGYQLREDEDVDLLLYNTCTVRDNANQRVYGRLGFANSRKKKNPDMLVGLCGCMMQEPSVIDRLKQSYSFVDIIFGTHNIYKLAELLYIRFISDGMVIDILPESRNVVENLPVERKYSFKSGVNIMYGCNNFCTFCIVPYVRGREHSRRPEEITAEIEGLVKDGVKEVMLLGQNVNSYGRGLQPAVNFSELLRRVEKIDGLERIRFMTSHPKDLSDELIATMKSSKKICRHLHLPLQSGSDEILRRMNRHYTKEKYLELALRIKAEIPDISLTTDIIVGFPGETEEDFQETLDVVRKVRYDSAFTFIYSPRTGTPAASMPDQVPKDVAQERLNRLIELVQQIARQECAKDTGKVMDALVEEEESHHEGLVTGRLSNNIMVHFPGSAELIGQIVPVRLLESRGFYYMGERVQ